MMEHAASWHWAWEWPLALGLVAVLIGWGGIGLRETGARAAGIAAVRIPEGGGVAAVGVGEGAYQIGGEERQARAVVAGRGWPEVERVWVRWWPLMEAVEYRGRLVTAAGEWHFVRYGGRTRAYLEGVEDAQSGWVLERAAEGVVVRDSGGHWRQIWAGENAALEVEVEVRLVDGRAVAGRVGEWLAVGEGEDGGCWVRVDGQGALRWRGGGEDEGLRMDSKKGR